MKRTPVQYALLWYTEVHIMLVRYRSTHHYYRVRTVSTHQLPQRFISQRDHVQHLPHTPGNEYRCMYRLFLLAHIIMGSFLCESPIPLSALTQHTKTHTHLLCREGLVNEILLELCHALPRVELTPLTKPVAPLLPPMTPKPSTVPNAHAMATTLM